MDTKMEDVIEVTVDKSHLITIGERLYGESIELIRELVNNTYDADATEVKITIADEQVVVEDNGSGMDMEGLKQYFNIGSPEKKLHPKSPRFNRDRIGEFGIGKFATLSACPHFEVWTKKDNFQARVIFDKDEWQRSRDRWHLPLHIEPPELDRPDGTKVTLLKLAKRFELQDVERRLIETVPIRVENFAVYLNGKRVTARYLPGQHIPFLEGTEFGIIHGEIIIGPQSGTDLAKELGIECKVKQVTIKRELFGMEKWAKDIARISGQVYADFLPVTSDRTDFIKDSPEYEIFSKVMSKIVERVKGVFEDISDSKENRKAKRTLREVMDRVKKALILNPDYCPEGLIPIGEESGLGVGQAGYISHKIKDATEEIQEVSKKEVVSRNKRKRKPQVKRLSPTAVIRKLQMGKEGVSCCIDHLGSDGPECTTEETVIYINRDHPLYQKEIKRKDTHILHIARLLTQEISLMKNPRNPRQAYERQSRLLKDALMD